MKGPLACVVAMALIVLASSCVVFNDDIAMEAPADFIDPTDCPTHGPPAPAAVRRDAAPEDIEGVFTVDTATDDVETDECPTYAFYPPASGPYATIWANCGFYDRAVSPPHAAYSIRNGAIWIAYGPDTDERSLDVLRATATSASHILVSPVEGLGAPIVMSAWGRQLWLDDVDDPRFDTFINTYIHSVNRPVIYTACRDGRGRPAASFFDVLDES